MKKIKILPVTNTLWSYHVKSWYMFRLILQSHHQAERKYSEKAVPVYWIQNIIIYSLCFNITIKLSNSKLNYLVDKIMKLNYRNMVCTSCIEQVLMLPSYSQRNVFWKSTNKFCSCTSTYFPWTMWFEDRHGEEWVTVSYNELLYY